MRVDTAEANQAVIHLAPGERFHFALRYLRGRDFGVGMFPPCPLGSPLVRLWHGCYWLGRCTAAPAGSEIRLTGPTVIGNFRTLELAAGESRFISAGHLVGFAFGPGGRLRTQLSRLLSPTMWALDQPLPVIAHGPGTVLLYGEGLEERQVEAGGEFLPAQIVGFDATVPFLARALNPDRGVFSHVANAVGRQARWVFPLPTTVLLVPINRPEARVSRVVVHLLLHIACWVLLVFALNM